MAPNWIETFKVQLTNNVKSNIRLDTCPRAMQYMISSKTDMDRDIDVVLAFQFTLLLRLLASYQPNNFFLERQK